MPGPGESASMGQSNIQNPKVIKDKYQLKLDLTPRTEIAGLFFSWFCALPVETQGGEILVCTLLDIQVLFDKNLTADNHNKTNL